MMEAWSPPDPGIYQRDYSDSDLEEGEADLDKSREEQSPPRNPFIDDEAAETSVADDQPQQEDDKESDPNDCVVVAQLTENEANT